MRILTKLAFALSLSSLIAGSAFAGFNPSVTGRGVDASNWAAVVTGTTNPTDFANGFASLQGFDADSTDNIVTIEQDTVITNDRVWIIPRLVFVTNGATLFVEPGTIFRGEQVTITGTIENPADIGVLTISRTGEIIARGTAKKPIIFTSLEDPYVPNLLGAGRSTIPSDAQQDIAGVQPLPGDNYTKDWFNVINNGDNAFAITSAWGGVIMLGNARVAFRTSVGNLWENSSDDPQFTPPSTVTPGVGANSIEGFQAIPEGYYGGLDDADSSGHMSFVSIRFCGFGFLPDNEVNGFTLGGVGSCTNLEFMEIYASSDDDFEWFGGSVNQRNFVATQGGDDAFDRDEGFLGKTQFAFSMQDPTGRDASRALNLGSSDPFEVGTGRGPTPDNAWELDGANSGDGSLPFGVWDTYNATIAGAGIVDSRVDTTYNGDQFGPDHRDNSAGSFYNTIITLTTNAGVALESEGIVDMAVRDNDNIAGSNPAAGAPNTSAGFTDPFTGSRVVVVDRFTFPRSTGGERVFPLDADFTGPGAVQSEPDTKFRGTMWFDINQDRRGFQGVGTDGLIAPTVTSGGRVNNEPSQVQAYFDGVGTIDGRTFLADENRKGVDPLFRNLSEFSYIYTDFDGDGLPLGVDVTLGETGDAGDLGVTTVDTLHADDGAIELGPVDPRVGVNSPARTGTSFTPPLDGFYVPTNCQGAFFDNMWLMCWSILDQSRLCVIPNPCKNVATPVMSLRNTDGDQWVEVVFTAANENVKYSIERSEDCGNSWQPLTVVQAPSAANLNISFEDVSVLSSPALSTTEVRYRIYPL